MRALTGRALTGAFENADAFSTGGRLGSTGEDDGFSSTMAIAMAEALQLCPNDHPPFPEVCAGHARALALLGYRVRTVFFESRGVGRPLGFEFDYATPSRLIDHVGRPELLVSHRHRAYRTGVGLARRLSIPRHIVVAHEFGMFARYTRRLRRRLWASGRPCFAGVSPPVADDLSASGIPSPVVLPNPVDAAALRRGLLPRAAARRALGLPEGAFAIGVVGRLHPKKDPLRAVDVFARYRARDPAACLVFIGSGPMGGKIREKAGVGVTLAGFRPDARALLGAFDAVLSCATEREAFGLVLLEAMAAGVPVIAADQPGPRYVLDRCGAYFETDDELLDALRATRAAQVPEAGGAAQAFYRECAARRVEDEFSIDALAHRYRTVLDLGPGSNPDRRVV